jgi:hypothetical protein
MLETILIFKYKENFYSYNKNLLKNINNYNHKLIQKNIDNFISNLINCEFNYIHYNAKYNTNIDNNKVFIC